MSKVSERVEVRFILNKANPKDKIIIEFIEKQYDTNSFIKSELYKMAMNNKIKYANSNSKEFATKNNKIADNVIDTTDIDTIEETVEGSTKVGNKGIDLTQYM